MPYYIVRISPEQRTQAQDLNLPRWKDRTPPPEGKFISVYASALDTLYTTDRNFYDTLKQKFTESEFISGVVYMPNLSQKRHAAPAKESQFDTWHLVQRKS